MDHDDKREAGRQGGLARKEALSPNERKAIAQRGAAAKWGKPLVAIHKGNFSKEFGVDVECYVLSDATRTAVISQRGMGKALGLSERGNSLPRFLNSKVMSEAIGAEVIEKLKNPLKFQWGSGGAEQPPAEVHGYDATLLIDLCKAIINAYEQGKLGDRYSKVAQQASIILSASAKSGIKGLVWALAGYNPTADEVIQAFKVYVQEEAKKYEPEFPEALYGEWYRLYQIPVHPGRGWPWQFKHLTVRHVYYPLAKSNGKLLELLRALKARGGDQKKKLFQFLNDLGARALRIHIGRLLEMTETSASQAEYENKIAARFGGQTELDLMVPAPPVEPKQVAEQTT
ncbi:MAG TPA: P63C domain-containing protein [Casimicrobiaceae bacterium]